MDKVKSVLNLFKEDAAKKGLKVKTNLDSGVSPLEFIQDKIDKISPCSVATSDLTKVVVEISSDKKSDDKIKKCDSCSVNHSHSFDISFLSKPENDCFNNIYDSYISISNRFSDVKSVSDDTYDLCIKEIDASIHLIKAFINIIKQYDDDRYYVVIDYIESIRYEIYEFKFGLNIRKQYIPIFNDYSNIINDIQSLKHSHSSSNNHDNIYDICKKCIPNYIPSPLKIRIHIKNTHKVIDNINSLINDTVFNHLKKSFIDRALIYIVRLEQIVQNYNVINTKISKMKRRITDTELSIIVDVIDYINDNKFDENLDKNTKKKLSKKSALKFKKLTFLYKKTLAIKIQKIVRGWKIRKNWDSIKRAYISRKKQIITNNEIIPKKIKKITNYYEETDVICIHSSIKEQISQMANLYLDMPFNVRNKFYYSDKKKSLVEKKLHKRKIL